MAKSQWSREKQPRGSKNRSDSRWNDDFSNDCCNFQTPNLRTLLCTCSGTDLLDKKPNFYKLTQLQQNIIKLLERPKSLSNLFHCSDTLKVTSITAVGPLTQWYTRKRFT